MKVPAPHKGSTLNHRDMIQGLINKGAQSLEFPTRCVDSPDPPIWNIEGGGLLVPRGHGPMTVSGGGYLVQRTSQYMSRQPIFTYDGGSALQWFGVVIIGPKTNPTLGYKNDNREAQGGINIGAATKVRLQSGGVWGVWGDFVRCDGARDVQIARAFWGVEAGRHGVALIDCEDFDIRMNMTGTHLQCIDMEPNGDARQRIWNGVVEIRTAGSSWGFVKPAKCVRWGWANQGGTDGKGGLVQSVGNVLVSTACEFVAPHGTWLKDSHLKNGGMFLPRSAYKRQPVPPRLEE